MKNDYSIATVAFLAALATGAPQANAAIGSIDGGGGSTGKEIIWDEIATGTATFCFRFDAAFTDNSGDYTGELGVGRFRARGVRFSLTNLDLGLSATFYASSTSGCRTVKVVSGARYRVRMVSKAILSHGMVVEVMNGSATQQLFGRTVAASMRPQNGGSYTYGWDSSASGEAGDASSVLAAATYAIHRRHTTWDETVRFYFEASPTGCEACFSSADDAIYLETTNKRRRKFTVAHEVGHALMYYRNESRTTNLYSDYGLTSGRKTARALGSVRTYQVSTCADDPTSDPDTRGHSLNSEERTLASFNEALAEFYGAAVWNHGGQVDCTYAGWSCTPSSNSLVVACYANDGIVDHVERSTVELDWVRFLWDVQTGCGISYSRIISLWDGAQMHSASHAGAQQQLLDRAEAFLSSSDASCFEAAMRDSGAFPNYTSLL